MDKKSARILYRQKRLQLTQQERTRMDDLILIRFQNISLPMVETLLTYYPMPQQHEPETELCSRFLQFQQPGLRICYPKTNTSAWTMEAIVTDENTEFSIDNFGLEEPVAGDIADPQSIDIVFVPMLVMDEDGYRVGFGKGCYDRYLARCRPDCIKIGFSYFEPIEKIEDRDEFDVPLDFGVTPGNVYVF